MQYAKRQKQPTHCRTVMLIMTLMFRVLEPETRGQFPKHQ